MIDIIDKLAQVRGDNQDALEAIVEIRDLRDIRASLNNDLLAAEAEIERLRTTLGYLADNISEPALVAVAETALKPKP